MAFADLAQNVLHGHLTVVHDERAGRRSADAQFVLLRPHRESGIVALDQKSRELFAIHLGKNCEQVGEASIGDPHFLAVQDVVLAVGGEFGAGAAIQRVGSGGRFRKSISPDPFAGR